MRFCESAPVNNFLPVKNSNVRKIPGFYQPSFIEPNFLCRKSGHFLNGLFQREKLFLPAKSPQNTRKSSIAPRVWFPLFKHSLSSAHGTIGTNKYKIPTQYLFQIFFAHTE